YLDVPLGAHLVAKAVLANAAAGMNDHVVADERMSDRGARPDRAVTPDLDVCSDGGCRSDCGPRANGAARPDRRTGVEAPPVLDLGRGMDDRSGSNTLRSKQGRRTQGIWEKLASYRNERRVRLRCAQHAQLSRRVGCKPLGGQAGARTGRAKRVGI